MRYTYLGGNSWFAEMRVSNVRVLCDPWLVGDLTFFDMPALYVGRKALSESERWLDLARGADVILLSQGWEDHAHVPTLKALLKTIPDVPVVGSPAAADVARGLGFANVTSLRANARTVIRPRRADADADANADAEGLAIIATEGALVGPPWSTREAGFVLADGADGARLYYEPHCSYDPESVRAATRAAGGRVDACVTPIRSVDVAGFTLVSGGAQAATLLERLGVPRVVLPLRNGELEQEGASAGWLGTDGTTRDAFARACDARFGEGRTTVEWPTPGEGIEIEVVR